jgi:hypothetical protein
MTAHMVQRLVTELHGDEIITLEHGLLEKKIAAKDFRLYVGGDTAVPALRLEAGANAQKISDLPNSDGPMAVGDVLTGLHNGSNVNFTLSQVVAPLVDVIAKLVVRCENIERLLQAQASKTSVDE